MTSFCFHSACLEIDIACGYIGDMETFPKKEVIKNYPQITIRLDQELNDLIELARAHEYDVPKIARNVLRETFSKVREVILQESEAS